MPNCSIFHVLNILCYAYFAHIATSSKAIHNVTNEVTRRMFNAKLELSTAPLTIKFDEISSFVGRFECDLRLMR